MNYTEFADERHYEGINLYRGDCMDLMKQTPDKYFELAIIDPPYGGGQHFNFRFGTKVFENKVPDRKYFEELFRVSKNQIVWDGNYFTDKLPVNRCWISWYKGQPIDSFSDFELAWTSFDRTSRAIFLESYGFNHADTRLRGEKIIFPTQKPVALYEHLLHDYAKPGDKILDTHLGSGSIAIACWDMGFDLTGIEIDKEYFDAAIKRFETHKAQLQIKF